MCAVSECGGPSARRLRLAPHRAAIHLIHQVRRRPWHVPGVEARPVSHSQAPKTLPWIPGESSKLDKLSSPQSMAGINHGMGSRSSENVMTSTAHHSPCRRQPAAWSRFRQSMLEQGTSA